jgi:MYXO-CTERM domain-containing protein
VLGSVTLLATLACGTVAPSELGTAVAKVEGGQLDAESKHVFRVLARVTGFNELCSATLIAPQLMLTARHCVAPTPGGNVNCETDRFGPTVAPSELKFSNDVEPNLSSRWFDAASVLVSPDSDFTCGYDIAVVLLDEPVPPEVAKPAEPRFFPWIESGEPYSAVGYGGSDADEEAAEYGIRHSRSGLSVACGQSNNCADHTVMSQEFLGTEGACKGDSGGPALDENGQVIGVLSRGADGCESPIYVGVPAFEALLVSAAQQANRTLGAPLPVWAGGDPIPVATAPIASSEAPADVTDEIPPSENDAGETAEVLPPATLARESCSVAPANTPSHTAWLLLLGIATFGWRRQRSEQSGTRFQPTTSR